MVEVFLRRRKSLLDFVNTYILFIISFSSWPLSSLIVILANFQKLLRVFGNRLHYFLITFNVYITKFQVWTIGYNLWKILILEKPSFLAHFHANRIWVVLIRVWPYPFRHNIATHLYLTLFHPHIASQRHLAKKGTKPSRPRMILLLLCKSYVTKQKMVSNFVSGKIWVVI